MSGHAMPFSSSALWLFSCAFLPSCSREPPPPPARPLTFSGSTESLKSTQIVATLDSPLAKGKNAVWCASFLCSWKSLGEVLVQEPISLEGDPPMARALEQALDFRPLVPDGSLYTAAGWLKEGIAERIAKDLKLRFPGKTPPSFEGAAPDGFIAYSYIEAGIKFRLPYFQSRYPLRFSESGGKKVEVESFGIRHEDESGYEELRAQPRVLFRRYSPEDGSHEFAVDLYADSAPSQCVVALIKPEATLGAMVERVEKEAQAGPGGGLSRMDVLLVPDMAWEVSHRYAEIEGKAFLNQRLKGNWIQEARQDVLFRLNRSGVELKSEALASIAAIMAVPDLVLDRPFLVYMKTRGAKLPYFVLWVDNAELLCPWVAR